MAAGNLSSRVLVGLEAKATWEELVQGSILECRIEELRGKVVLLATIDQFRAAAALIQLDGVARRVVLFPPDVPLEHLPYVARTAEADVLVTDRLEMTSIRHEIGRVILCEPNIVPVNADRGVEIETEWILLTSGTTGAPKLALHTLASLAGSALHRSPASASIVWSTFYDMRRYGGLHIFLHAALIGTSLVVSSAQEQVADFLTRAGAHGVTHISGTPSHWRRALMSPLAERIAPEYIRMSGEIVDQAILNQVKAKYPQARVEHTFASTEAGVGFYVSDGLMGFPPELLKQNPLVEMKVEDGTLKIRSNRAAFRYLGAASPSLKGADGFVDTGDTVELRDGRYYFTGRRDGIINVGGFKVHPEEVEAVINRHPDVVMSMAKAKRNPITGAIVVADVVAKVPPELGGLDALQRDILQFCRAELATYKVPAAIHIVPMLVIGESGKLVRRNA
jgi:acyl-coenzyme A synthetase/AMP-(fatty) acid ligase